MVKWKLAEIQSVLRTSQIDAWLLITSEASDPYFAKLISGDVTVPTAAIIAPDTCTVITHGLEVDNIEMLEGMNIVQYNYSSPLHQMLATFFNDHKNLQSIALNYSTMLDAGIDILGHGFYEHFVGALVEACPHLSRESFTSAESLIYAKVDRKSERDLDRLRLAARRADQIIRDSFEQIRSGMTEIELVKLVHRLKGAIPSYLQEADVIAEEYAWSEAMCPIALTGNSFTKGGHAISGLTKVKPGNTVYFDFGVKLTFADGESWSSDLQRTAYLLKRGENKPPATVLKKFKDIIDSIDQGIENIKPGMKGYEADAVVREFLLSLGYPSYDHGTGHSIGELAHNPGTNLSPDQSGSSRLSIQPNGVYTIEPRIPVRNGVSIEEMVVFRESGKGEALSPRQLAPILISST